MTDNPSKIEANLTDEEAAEIGRAFMERFPSGYSYNDSPAEIITDLENEAYDLRAVLEGIAAEGCARFRNAQPPRWCGECVWCRARAAVIDVEPTSGHETESRSDNDRLRAALDRALTIADSLGEIGNVGIYADELSTLRFVCDGPTEKPRS